VSIGSIQATCFTRFWTSIFAGLLGSVEYDAERGIAIQRFRRPHDSLTHSAADLPDSQVYHIHPALDTVIRAQRTRTPFVQFQHVPVGDDMLWELYFPTAMQIEKQLQKIDVQRFVDLAHQVVKRVQSLLTSGKTPFARVEIESSQEWKALCGLADNEACCDALLWLEELWGGLLIGRASRGATKHPPALTGCAEHHRVGRLVTYPENSS
jgi:hypothetical protein